VIFEAERDIISEAEGAEARNKPHEPCFGTYTFLSHLKAPQHASHSRQGSCFGLFVVGIVST